MSFSSPRNQIFHRIVAVFIRTRSRQLLHCIGPLKHDIESSWTEIKAHLHDAAIEKLVSLEIKPSIEPALRDLVVFDRPWGPNDEIIGIVLKAEDGHDSSQELDKFFCSIIIDAIDIEFKFNEHHIHPGRQSEWTTDAVVEHFETTLKYSSHNDEWNTKGRAYFRKSIEHFISKGQRIQFCLPAFPCKSSNLDKVQGARPDRGEFVALSNLNRFIEGIERLYRPGAKLWIISDGHVFSDCIGVDDAVVDAYGSELEEMNKRITGRHGGKDRIGFKSLEDLFALDKSFDSAFIESEIPNLDHHLSTTLNYESELCRRILMTGFQTEGDDLRQRIKLDDAPTLALYRGFSKFMLEDLDQSIYTRDLSRSRRRKLSSKIAFEMIRRNQAYSNLVETLFPHHVRLSIHAHSNSGPKFGIQMYGPGVRATNVLAADGALMQSNDLLHIPTPWHNCMVEIKGHADLYVTKSSIARSAISNGKLYGGPAGAFEEDGQYFFLAGMPLRQSVTDLHSTQEALDKRLDRAGDKQPVKQEVSIKRLGLRHLFQSLWGCIH